MHSLRMPMPHRHLYQAGTVAVLYQHSTVHLTGTRSVYHQCHIRHQLVFEFCPSLQFSALLWCYFILAGSPVVKLARQHRATTTGY